MPEIAAPPAGPFMPIGIAAKLLKGSPEDVERLVRAGKVEARGAPETPDRMVNSGQVIFHIRARRAEEIERRLTGREPYERIAGFEWSGGSKFRSDARRTDFAAPPVILDVLPPGASTVCLDCPAGPNGTPCNGCPAPCTPPPPPYEPAPRRRPSFWQRLKGHTE